jgi:putative transposase
MPLSSHPKRHFKGGCGKVATTNDVRTEPPVRTLAGRGSGSAFRMSERLTWACCGLVGLHPKTYRFASKRTGDEGLRARLRELASQRWRFGYRRLGLMLERQGIKLSPKNLPALPGRTAVRAQAGGGRKRALGTRAPMAIPQDRNLRWSLDFVLDKLLAAGASASSPYRGRRLHPGLPRPGGRHLAHRPTGRVRAQSHCRDQGLPPHDRQRQRPSSPRTPSWPGGKSWRRMALHSRRAKPMQNGFVESFNGRLRDECLNEHLFTNTNRARSTPQGGAKLEQTLLIKPALVFFNHLPARHPTFIACPSLQEVRTVAQPTCRRDLSIASTCKIFMRFRLALCRLKKPARKMSWSAC